MKIHIKKIVGIIIIAIIVIIVLSINMNKENGNRIKNKTIKTSEQNESAIYVKEREKLEIDNIEIEKEGDSENLTESDKKGKNAAILVGQISEANINNSKITTNGKGSTAIVSTGAGSSVSINNTSLATTKERSKGILASNKGKVVADDVSIKTDGSKSSAVATDFGGGTIQINNSEIETNSVDSAGVYSTGDITVQNTRIETNQADGAVIDGDGKITLQNVYITSYKKRGVMILYTGPQINKNIIGNFKMSRGSLYVKEGPAFYTMNTASKIELENVDIKVDSNILFKASTDELGELGQEVPVKESKGGDAIILAKNQELEGDIVADAQSTIDLKLGNNCKYKGKINTENTAKSIKLYVTSDNIIELTGECNITELEIEKGATIITNGYNIYYNLAENIEGINIQGNGKLIKK